MGGVDHNRGVAAVLLAEGYVMLQSRLALALAAAVVLLPAVGRTQGAQSKNIVRKPLPAVLDVTTGDLPKTPTAAVEIRKGAVAAGGTTIWHTHPSPSFVYVESGAGTWEFRGQPPQVRTAGQAIEELPNVVTRIVNHGATPLNLVIFQVSKPGQPVLTPAP